jgi:glycyl-tRNA synthetase
MAEAKNDLMEKLIALCKRRGFIFPGSDIYGGLANSWDYGPLGAQLKKNIKDEWWRRFVERRSDMVGIDAALIMNPKVWEASGHLKTFSDPLVECKKCNERFRADQIDTKAPCQNCKAKDSFTEAKQFNMMLKTSLGPKEDTSSIAYLRPETAQAMFVNFKNVLDTSRKRLPFGIASQGRAFRNEITPGNFIFRQREFDLMEFEYFVKPTEWEQYFEYWLAEMKKWVKDLGVSDAKVHYVEISEADRAHYSKRTIDVEYEYPFGQKELYGLAYRSSFDLDSHMKASGADLQYMDPVTNEKFVPHVIEPAFGLDRSVLVTLLEAYTEDTTNERTYLKLPYWTAPYKVAVFPLLANKPALVEKARSVYNELVASSFQLTVAWDDRGNVGKRYYAQDEIGTPFCITVDFDTLGEEGSDPAKIDTVTVRNRDTMQQERVKISELQSYLADKLAKG